MTLHRYQQAGLAMDTVVSLAVVTAGAEAEAKERMAHAFATFAAVERICSRFDGESEVARLSRTVGVPVPVSSLLFEAIRFAWQVAEATGGAFDPTVGQQLQALGFTHNYLTGERPEAGGDPADAGDGADSGAPVSYRDLVLDEVEHTVLLRRPLVIDLGAVAKGLAVDLAARDLAGCEGFVIDAGGDIYAGGCSESGVPWAIGIQDPQRPGGTVTTLRLSDAAVCTSGSYERPSPAKTGAHHLVDPRTGGSPSDLLSCTVIAPFAMMADAFSTAAFVLGRERGAALLAEAGLRGLFIDRAGVLHATPDEGGDMA
jgi:thiamine biosynthesis lipoprotein